VLVLALGPERVVPAIACMCAYTQEAGWVWVVKGRVQSAFLQAALCCTHFGRHTYTLQSKKWRAEANKFVQFFTVFHSECEVALHGPVPFFLLHAIRQSDKVQEIRMWDKLRQQWIA